MEGGLGASCVRHNDWREVGVEALETFEPAAPVSVVIPCYQTPRVVLAKTLVALEGQSYPSGIFEVVLVDDGSEPPVACPNSSVLNISLVRQRRRGFGLARARNTGARAAAHGILLFLDSDLVVDADWIASHARWHHAVCDAVSLGLTARVSADGVSAGDVRGRAGSLGELFSGMAADSPRFEGMMARTADLTSADDDLFRAAEGGNLGIRADFFWSAGGYDESFERWGIEDTELVYRAFTRGALLAPVRDQVAWHQGLWPEGRIAKERSRRLQRGKAAHLIAHPSFRGNSPGRIYKVPEHVVTIHADRRPCDDVIRACVNVLADRVHDLIVRIETGAGCDPERLARLREEFDDDPRVRVAPDRSAIEEFPVSPFHIDLPAAVFAKNLVHRLRAGLGTAAAATCTLADSTEVAIARTRAVHRARRTGKDISCFGDVLTLPSSAVKLKALRRQPPSGAEPVQYPTNWERVRDMTQDVRSLSDARRFLKQANTLARWKALNRWHTARWAPPQ